MPTNGQKLFEVVGGKLKTVIFVEQSLADESCTMATWLVRKRVGFENKLVRVSIGSYFENEDDAWKKYLDECEVGESYVIKEIEQSNKTLKAIQAEIARVQRRLSLSPEERQRLDHIEAVQNGGQRNEENI